jgi:hypothetical protein
MKEMVTKIHGQPLSNDFMKVKRNPTEQWESKSQKTKGTQPNNRNQSQTPKEQKSKRMKIRKLKKQRVKNQKKDESKAQRAKPKEQRFES